MSVTFADVIQAQKRIRPYLPRTPLHSYSALNKLIGTEVYVKGEKLLAIVEERDSWFGVKQG